MNSHILDPLDFLGQDADNKSIKTFEIVNKFHKDEKMSILLGQVPEYSIYFKMLKMGIPKDAIKQKMTLTGADSRVIDYPETAPYITVLHYISNPHLGAYSKPTISTGSGIPPPPPLPGISGMNGIPPPPPLPGMAGIPGIHGMDSSNNQARAGLLSAIASGGFKLKKVDPKEKMLAKLASNNANPNGMKVPSLMDIQGALARLKKVEID